MRLFLAINLPAEVRQDIRTAIEPVRRRGFPVRWVGADAIHLTLKFLGDVATDRESAVLAGAATAVQGARPFTLPITGFGAFPPSTPPRVIWVGCEAVPALEVLQHRLEHEMERLGFPLEGRAFRPHLTLGRTRREARAGDFKGFMDALGAVAYRGDVVVESVDLMESHLGPQGARYERRQALALDG